ncbi:unnamed protein product [Prorocentrum cordatum]|uniref:Protein kinase domain-containing protein n=1 Tax=Prorocentrum cordatum TaxID=2364126 RepID=A0ABN9W0C9_9DINO|nr:unnamed protein product [Polarella glacialis]
MLHFVETPVELVLLTRFAPRGDLSGCVPRNTCVEEAEVRKLSRQLLSALAFLSGRSIIHGDVKPSNIFLTELWGAMILQLADFGLSRRLPPGQTLVHLCQVQGSHGFIPAEVIHRKELHCASDLFSFGVFVFRYLGGYDPFYPASKVTDPLLFDEGSWRHVSPAGRDFVARTLAVEPAARGTARALLEEHPWARGPAAPAPPADAGRGLRFHDLEGALALWQRCSGSWPADADANPGIAAWPWTAPETRPAPLGSSPLLLEDLALSFLLSLVLRAAACPDRALHCLAGMGGRAGPEGLTAAAVSCGRRGRRSSAFRAGLVLHRVPLWDSICTGPLLLSMISFLAPVPAAFEHGPPACGPLDLITE